MAADLPQGLALVQLLAPTTTNGAATSRGVSLKNVIRAQVIVNLKQAVGHATVISLRQADVIALSNTATGPTVPNWKNEDCVTNDTLVKNADAAAVTVAANAKSMQVIFDVDPRKLSSGNKVIYVTSSDSSQATNFMTVEVVLEPRYAGDTPPSFVLD